MRYTWIFLLLALLFGYIANYVWHTQSPILKDKLMQDFEVEEIVTNEQAVYFVQDNVDLGTIYDYLNLKNLTVLILFVSLSVGSAVLFIHTLIDKLFFKKYYEEANLKVALRRALLLIIFLIFIVVLRIIAGLTWFTFVPTVILLLLIEYFFVTRSLPEKVNEEKTDDLVK